MTWRRLRTLIRGLANTPGTLLQRRLADDDWSLNDHLLALILDVLRIANWQRTDDGQRGRRQPDPVSPITQRAQRIGRTGGRSNEEIAAFLESIGPQRE